MNDDFKGRTVFITGTNRGIGRAMAEAFATHGADVIAHARASHPGFEEFARDLAERCGTFVTPIYFDMTDRETMKTTVRRVLAERASVDVLVNNAGIAHGGLFQMTPVSDIRHVLDVNLFAQMELTQLLLRPMMRRGIGCIINMASISGLDLDKGNCAYGVSKAALVAFTKTLAAECGPGGVRVNAIAPGLTDTDMAGLMELKAGMDMVARSAMNRLALPREIAEVALFLASDAASFVNGQVVRVDGGNA